MRISSSGSGSPGDNEDVEEEEVLAEEEMVVKWRLYCRASVCEAGPKPSGITSTKLTWRALPYRVKAIAAVQSTYARPQRPIKARAKKRSDGCGLGAFFREPKSLSVNLAYLYALSLFSGIKLWSDGDTVCII